MSPFSDKAAGTTAAAFLKAPPSARTAAMGGAAAAAGRGAEALFHNPALLARLEPESRSEAALGYDALVETAYAGSAAWARPWGEKGALAAGLVYASQSPQTGYGAQGGAEAKFTPSDLAAGAYYARRFGSARFGAGLKALRSSLADRSAVGVAADFGAHLPDAGQLGDGPVDLGASLLHLGPPVKLGSSSDPLPLRARGGALWRLSPDFDAALDAVFPSDQAPFAALGVEARLTAARLGADKPWSAAGRLGYDQSAARGVDGFSGLTAGFGLDLSALRADYAWTARGMLGASSRVTLAFRF